MGQAIFSIRTRNNCYHIENGGFIVAANLFAERLTGRINSSRQFFKPAKYNFQRICSNTEGGNLKGIKNSFFLYLKKNYFCARFEDKIDRLNENNPLSTYTFSSFSSLCLFAGTWHFDFYRYYDHEDSALHAL